jgi:hypothetical protein
LKIAGYVRAESHWVGGDTGYTAGDPDNLYGVHEGHVNNWTTRVRGAVSFDARTETSIGLVRSYIAYEMTIGPDADTDPAAGAAVFPGDEDDSRPDYSSTEPALASAFITVTSEWGTYTAGKRGSFFDFYGGDTYGSRLGLQDGTTDTTLFAWTFSLGNGFTATFAAEDPASSGRYANGDDDYEGQESPDGVVNFRVDQGWGSAQVMGAIRRIHDYAGPGDDNTDDDDIGFAIGAGLKLGIPGGWTFNSQAGYADGMVKYVSGDPGGVGDIDDVTAAGPDADTNTSWAVRAGLKGPLFNPDLTVWLNGTFISGEEDSSSDEYDFWAVVLGASYNLAPGLTIGPEFAYHNLEWDDSGAPDGTDEIADYDVWGAMWRIQRDF